MIQVNPLDSNSNFECLSCKSKESSERVETLVEDYSGKAGKTSKLVESHIRFSCYITSKSMFVMFQMMLFERFKRPEKMLKNTCLGLFNKDKHTVKLGKKKSNKHGHFCSL